MTTLTVNSESASKWREWILKYTIWRESWREWGSDREGLRQLTLSDDKGFGITIETEGTVSFSAIPYTDADLMTAQHFWNMQARPYTVLHLDAWTRGVGNASCGHDVDTLPEYRVPNKKMTYTLRISKM